MKTSTLSGADPLKHPVSSADYRQAVQGILAELTTGLNSLPRLPEFSESSEEDL